jgi:hypothetical protein
MATTLLNNHCSEEVDIGQSSLHKNITARREWEAFVGFFPHGSNKNDLHDAQ